LSEGNQQRRDLNRVREKSEKGQQGFCLLARRNF